MSVRGFRARLKQLTAARETSLEDVIKAIAGGKHTPEQFEALIEKLPEETLTALRELAARRALPPDDPLRDPNFQHRALAHLGRTAEVRDNQARIAEALAETIQAEQEAFWPLSALSPVAESAEHGSEPSKPSPAKEPSKPEEKEWRHGRTGMTWGDYNNWRPPLHF